MTAWCAHMIQRYSAEEAHALDANTDLKLLLHIMRRMPEAHIMTTLSALVVLCNACCQVCTWFGVAGTTCSSLGLAAAVLT